MKRLITKFKRSNIYQLLLFRIPGWWQSLRLPKDLPIPIEGTIINRSKISSYWNIHTVLYTLHTSPKESLAYNDWIDKQYPLYHDFMKLYEGYENQVVLDYGCGPANDLVGFLEYSNAKMVIGVDVSEKALRIASYRLGLHNFDQNRIRLILTDDSTAHIPLDDEIVDHIHSQGVLHHTLIEDEILKEFNRILKCDAYAYVMVYNYDSIFTHLIVAYRNMILDNAYPGMTLAEAFEKSTDGENCPVSRYNIPHEYIERCNSAGFETEFIGGYLAIDELNALHKWRAKALDDSRLAQEHKAFLRSLTYDENSYPMYNGKYAGIGGVYRLRKVKSI